MPERPVVRVGQVWEDQTPDMGARRIKVMQLTEHGRDVFDANLCRYVTEVVRMAHCAVVRGNADRKGTPRVVKVRVDRLRPGARGFRLVAHPCKPLDCLPTGRPESIGSWSDADAVWAWTCEHGRRFVATTDGPWGPVMTAEEVAERVAGLLRGAARNQQTEDGGNLLTGGSAFPEDR